MIVRRIFPATTLMLLLAIVAANAAEPAAEQPSQPADTAKKIEYMRVVRDDNRTPTALETAIIRCGPADPNQKGPTVDLVAVMHIAEEDYYNQLNREFDQYDAVLYELVAAEGSEVPGQEDIVGSPLALLQGGMTEMLGLTYQLGAIDYTRENMVHADMSPEEFAESMQDRRESFLAMFVRMMADALARQQEVDDSASQQLMQAFFEDDPTLALKRVLADQFQDMERWLTAIEGPQGSTLIGERNKVALGVLSQQLAAGKQKIAIFYGAAHMPNLQRGLQDQFQLTPRDSRWLTAWKLEAQTVDTEDSADRPSLDQSRQPVAQ